MDFWNILIISIGLAMDSCTMAICLGISSKKIKIKNIISIGIIFGFFQAIMPLIGYLFGSTFAHLIEKINHWLALFILSFIGINMIKESQKTEDVHNFSILTLKEICILGIATSIDALAVGVTFAFLNINIILASITIFITTCCISIIGAKAGNFITQKIKNINEKSMNMIGGTILILMGIKILIEHLIM